MAVKHDILSGSTNGRGIKVTGITTGASVTVHTAIAGTTAGTFDEVHILAMNAHTTTVNLTIEFGGTTSPDDQIVVPVPAAAGLVVVLPGLVLRNALVVKAFADVANVVTLHGWINQNS